MNNAYSPPGGTAEGGRTAKVRKDGFSYRKRKKAPVTIREITLADLDRIAAGFEQKVGRNIGAAKAERWRSGIALEVNRAKRKYCEFEGCPAPVAARWPMCYTHREP